MTAEEAFKILSKEYPLLKVRSCLDFGTFFAFCLAPLEVKDTDRYCTGTCRESVDKRTGKVFIYDITSNIDAYEQAKEVNVKTIFDKSIRDLWR